MPAPGTKKIDVYCPTGVAVTEKLLKFAPRIATFDNRRIGLLWNGKPNGNFFLKRVGELLGKGIKMPELPGSGK